MKSNDLMPNVFYLIPSTTCCEKNKEIKQIGDIKVQFFANVIHEPLITVYLYANHFRELSNALTALSE
jgi:hypothetical protein